MELSQIFTGSTLKAADLQGREPTVTIATVEAKKFNDGNKIVITFVGKEKAFVCNKTNANRIAYTYGTNTDNWIGKQITLYTDLVDFQGSTVEAIRVRPPQKHTSVAGGYQGDPISTGRPADHGGGLGSMQRQQAANVGHSVASDEIPF